MVFQRLTRKEELTANALLALVRGSGAIGSEVAEDGGGVEAGHALAARADVVLGGQPQAFFAGRFLLAAVDGHGALCGNVCVKKVSLWRQKKGRQWLGKGGRTHLKPLLFDNGIFLEGRKGRLSEDGYEKK